VVDRAVEGGDVVLTGAGAEVFDRFLQLSLDG